MIKCHFSNFFRKKFPSLAKKIACTLWTTLQVLPHDFYKLQPTKSSKVVQELFCQARKLFSAEIWKMTWKKKHSVRSTTTRHFDGFFGVMKESNVPHRFSVKILVYDDDDYYDSEWLSFWSFEDCIKDHIQITISDEIKCFGWGKILFRPVIFFEILLKSVYGICFRTSCFSK